MKMRSPVAFLCSFVLMVCNGEPGAYPTANPPRFAPHDEESDHNRPPVSLVNHTYNPTPAPAAVEVSPTDAPGKPRNPKRAAPHRGRVRGSTLPPTPSPTACIAPVTCPAVSRVCNDGPCLCNVNYARYTITVVNLNCFDVYIFDSSYLVPTQTTRSFTISSYFGCNYQYADNLNIASNDVLVCVDLVTFPSA